MATTIAISALGALTSTQSDDVLPIVDVHDTTQAPTGSTKKITVGNLLATVLPLTGGALTGDLSTTGQIIAPKVGTISGGTQLVLTNGATTVATLSTSLAAFPFAASIASTLAVAGLATLSAGATMGGGILFGTDNSFDIGGVGVNRPRNIYVADTVTASIMSIQKTNATLNLIGVGGSSRQFGIQSDTSGALHFIDYTAVISRWNLSSGGHWLASQDNTYNIGSSGANRPANIYCAGTVTANAFSGDGSAVTGVVARTYVGPSGSGFPFRHLSLGTNTGSVSFPADGDLWYNGTHLMVRIGGVDTVVI